MRDSVCSIGKLYFRHRGAMWCSKTFRPWKIMEYGRSKAQCSNRRLIGKQLLRCLFHYKKYLQYCICLQWNSLEMCSSKSLIGYCVCFFDQLAHCIEKFRLNIIGKYMYILATALHLMNILFSAVWLIIPIKEWASTQNREMESIQMCLDALYIFFIEMI